MRCTTHAHVWASRPPHRGVPSVNALWVNGNGKREGCTRAIVRLCPQTPMMALDDGTADGEPDSHPVGLRCVEGVKQLVHVLRVDAPPGIPHSRAHTVAVLACGSDQQLPRAIVH